MKSHKYLTVIAALLVSAALAAPSFAAKKALDDAAMDQATAKGQSAVSKGTGDQIIKDKSQASLEFKNTKGTDETVHNVPDYQKVEGGVVYPEGNGQPDCENCGPDAVRPTGPQEQALNNKQVTEEDDVLLNENKVQANAVAGNLINAAGENNVAATVNAASSSGGAQDTIEQSNDIDQSKAAFVDQSQIDIEEFSLTCVESSSKTEDSVIAKNKSESKTETETKDKSFGLTAGLTISKTENETWTESFPEATITINMNSDATSTANGDATATSNAESVSTSTSTADASNTRTDTDTDTRTVTVNKNENINKDITINKGRPPLEQPVLLSSTGGSEGGNNGHGSRGGDGGVDVKVTKNETISDTETTDTDINARGVAAIAQSDAEGHEQAYASSAAEGQAKAEADADADLDLPTAQSGTSSETFNLDGSLQITKTYSKTETEECTETDQSTYDINKTREESKETTMTVSKDKSQLEVVQADHVKIGDGEQRICLETEYEIEMEGSAQNAARALNIINVVGRNNIATAWNLASSAGGTLDVSPFVSGGAPVAPGSIHQVNVVKQVN